MLASRGRRCGGASTSDVMASRKSTYATANVHSRPTTARSSTSTGARASTGRSLLSNRHPKRPTSRTSSTMPDDKKKIGKADRDRVSANEPYEVARIAKKFELPKPLVQNVIKQEGPMRKDVEKYLEKMKKK